MPTFSVPPVPPRHSLAQPGQYLLPAWPDCWHLYYDYTARVWVLTAGGGAIGWTTSKPYDCAGPNVFDSLLWNHTGYTPPAQITVWPLSDQICACPPVLSVPPVPARHSVTPFALGFSGPPCNPPIFTACVPPNPLSRCLCLLICGTTPSTAGTSFECLEGRYPLQWNGSFWGYTGPICGQQPYAFLIVFACFDGIWDLDIRFQIHPGGLIYQTGFFPQDASSSNPNTFIGTNKPINNTVDRGGTVKIMYIVEDPMHECTSTGGSGSGPPANDCCEGNCGDPGVLPTLTATVTSEVGCCTSLPSVIHFSCTNAGSPPNGQHLWTSTTPFTACGVSTMLVLCVGIVGNTTPYIAFAGTEVPAQPGWTCNPFSAVFLWTDGAGDSCTITVVSP